MESSSFDTKQLILIGLMLVALYFFGLPYFIGHHNRQDVETVAKPRAATISAPRPDAAVNTGAQKPPVENTSDNDSLSEIEKLLQ